MWKIGKAIDMSLKGPSWGISGTEFRGIDINGSSTDEIYKYDFK